MKPLLIMALLFFMNLNTAFCPNIKTFYITKDSPIIRMPIYTASYEPLIKAIHLYETGGCDTLINIKEQAYGGLQIRQCRLDHYNKLTGMNYTLKDMFDFTKAKEVFLYFATHNNLGLPCRGKSYEQVAKNWNGSGPLTESYWASIQDILNPNLKLIRQKQALIVQKCITANLLTSMKI
jgi:hypothetical protein